MLAMFPAGARSGNAEFVSLPLATLIWLELLPQGAAEPRLLPGAAFVMASSMYGAAWRL
jgi:hypothetical protein